MRVDTMTIASGAGDHVLHFYEHDAELAGIVARWLRDATSEDVCIVVATQAHRDRFAAAVAGEGDPSVRCRVVWLDAGATLAQFVVDGEIDDAAFRAVVGTVVRDASQGGRSVRVYGEMVALLWDAGNVLGAIALEGLWNDLARETPFALLCSYPAAIHGDPERGDALDQVCEAHSTCHHTWPNDGAAVIGGSPANGVRAAFSSRPSAPGYARRVTARALRQWGYPAAVAQAAELVVSELVTNAVLHADSDLTLNVHRDDDLLRIAVQDTTRLTGPSPTSLLVAQPGHGLGIVEALSAQWGVQLLRDGKIVWAQIQAGTPGRTVRLLAGPPG